MNKLHTRLKRIFGSRNQRENRTYQLYPYSPAYHPSLVVRKRLSIAGWVKVSGAGLILVFTVAGYTGWRSLSEVNQIYAMQKNTAKPYEATEQTQLKTDSLGKTNILLLGIAGVGNKGADLTDMMTILQVDKATKKTSYIVMPRKLVVQSPSAYYGEWQALNTVYSAGKYSYLHKADAASADPIAKQAGFTAIDRTITDITGLTIHYNMVIDYAAFMHAIDNIGGITVSVPKRIVDRPLMKEYGKSTVVATRGEQTMTGKQVVAYVRTFAGDDEKVREAQRLERQMQVVKAYIKKLSSIGVVANPIELRDSINGLGASFYSDMKPAESVLSAQLLLGAEMRYSGFILNDPIDILNPFTQSGTVNNDRLVPKAGQGAYGEVQSYFAKRLQANVPQGKEFAILE